MIVKQLAHARGLVGLALIVATVALAGCFHAFRSVAVRSNPSFIG